MNKYEVYKLLKAFLSDDPGLDKWAWDDFTSVKQASEEIEQIRLDILDIDARNSAEKKVIGVPKRASPSCKNWRIG